MDFTESILKGDEVCLLKLLPERELTKICCQLLQLVKGKKGTNLINYYISWLYKSVIISINLLPQTKVLLTYGEMSYNKLKYLYGSTNKKILSMVLFLLHIFKFNSWNLVYVLLYCTPTNLVGYLGGSELKRSMSAGRQSSITWAVCAALFINLLHIQSFRTFSYCQKCVSGKFTAPRGNL